MKKWAILLITITLVSCTSNTIFKKPKNLIKKDKMVNIITDMLLANSAENVKNLQEEREINYYPLVYEKYGIDSLRFKESAYYYISTIDDYTEILKKVELKLDKTIKKLQQEEVKEKDSLEKIEPTKLKGEEIELIEPKIEEIEKLK